MFLKLAEAVAFAAIASKLVVPIHDVLYIDWRSWSFYTLSGLYGLLCHRIWCK